MSSSEKAAASDNDSRHSVPNLSALTLAPKPLTELTRNAPDGQYCLDLPGETLGCDSSVLIFRNAIKFSDEETNELKTFMLDEELVPKTPNPLNKTYFLKRRQTTFGAGYNFGQKMSSHNSDVPWPTAVTKALEFAKEFAEARGIAKELYNGVHANYYADWSVGVSAHSDAETDMLRGLPIISVTLLSGEKMARPFSIYEKPMGKGRKPIKIADVLLDHGDVIIMLGRMQEKFLHAVETTDKKMYAKAERMNLTVRAFSPDAVARAGKGR